MADLTTLNATVLRILRCPVVGMMCLAMVGGGLLTRGSAAFADEALFDTTLLPRIPGANELYANPATTSFTTPGPVAQSADATRKMLAADGWQEYGPLSATAAGNPRLQIINMKKGNHGLNVLVTVAPAQNKATAVSYTATYLATDLPFPKDATEIDYQPDLPLLTCFTAASIDDALSYFQTELGVLGWSRWSATNGAPPSAAASAGVKTRNGAYAYYTKINSKPLLLLLRRGEDNRTQIEIKAVPETTLNSEASRATRTETLPGR